MALATALCLGRWDDVKRLGSTATPSERQLTPSALSRCVIMITQHTRKVYEMKNKALSALEPFIGKWEYTMYNCWFLESMDTRVKGFTTIERLHDSFVVIRNSDADKKPDDIWVIGYSDPQEKYQMFYYDQRGVSRIFDASFDGQKMVFQREDNDMHQRVTLEITSDGLHSVAEASEDQGTTWRKDLEMAYVKIE
jgi:hypothetical protein